MLKRQNMSLLAWHLGPKNAPFEAVEELEQVLGMTPNLYERVAPYLTTYNPPAPTDVCRATESVFDPG